MHCLTTLLVLVLVSLPQGPGASLFQGLDRRALCKTVETVDCRNWPINVVCASDGRTYENSCVFVQAHCRNVSLHVRHPGRCYMHLTSRPRPSVQANNIILSLVCLDILALDCRRTMSTPKICGSDGKTYRNNCRFEKSRCRNHNLQMKNTGPCIT
ncbi:follistatin-A-like [Gigantopelta aegis]|uniref:follistatin-A-like n=1 Tax=Gigantopelta aegis TaxID=1735272 RepID=UPI001B887BD2|nr:follistatin-A-like [Gigantopelta aegis]